MREPAGKQWPLSLFFAFAFFLISIFLGRCYGSVNRPIPEMTLFNLSSQVAIMEILPIPGPYLWLKANGGVIASGGVVSAWQDQSGNQNHVFGQATYVPGALSGMPVVRFSSSANDQLQASTGVQFFTSANQGLTVFTVFNTSDPNNQRFLLTLYLGHCSTNIELGYMVDQVNAGDYGLHLGCGAGSVSPSGTILSGSYYLMTLRVMTAGGAPGNIEIFQNGNPLAVGAANGGTWLSAGSYGTTAGLLTIGARGNLVPPEFGLFDAFHDGDIAEIILYRSALSDSDRISLECFLSQKYGLTVAGCP